MYKAEGKESDLAEREPKKQVNVTEDWWIEIAKTNSGLRKGQASKVSYHQKGSRCYAVAAHRNSRSDSNALQRQGGHSSMYPIAAQMSR